MSSSPAIFCASNEILTIANEVVGSLDTFEMSDTPSVRGGDLRSRCDGAGLPEVMEDIEGLQLQPRFQYRPRSEVTSLVFFV